MAFRFLPADLGRKIRLRYLRYAFSFRRSLGRKRQAAGGGFTFVIFSKDRPLQLHGLLESLFHFVEGEFRVEVLFAASDARFLAAYAELSTGFASRPGVRFHRQSRTFRDSLIGIMDAIAGGRLFFLVDDILFKNPFKLADLAAIDSSREIFSLRHGRHLDFSHIVSKPQPLPPFRSAGKWEGKDAWKWKWGEGKLDWAYPLSVDGHLFLLADARYWVERFPYRAPNSFESALQVLNPIYHGLDGVCLEESIVFNNPCNKVQSEVANPHGGLDASQLLSRWEEGLAIDFLAFKGFRNGGVHQEVEFRLIKRAGHG